MDTTDFLRRVTGTAGFYCLLALKNGQRRQKFYPSAEQLINSTENFDEQGYDAYFALGRFIDAESRTAANVGEMGSLSIDIDCGPNKDYPDQVSGLKALRSFIKRTGLPKPIIVNSGRGLHAYWPLAEPTKTAAWYPVAVRLKSACTELGLRIDSTATSDAARVLRLPGSRNHKDNPPRPVEILHEGDEPSPLPLLDGLISPHAKGAGRLQTVSADSALFGDDVGVAPAAKKVEMNAAMQALMGNIESSFKKIAQKTAAGKGCAQIGAMLEDPAGVPEPLWRAGLSIAVCCEEKKAIHWLSKGHPDYDPEETARKAKQTKGPYTCQTFKSLNPESCEDCPLWGKITSPIQIGKVIAEAEDGAEPVKRQEFDPVPTPKPGEIPKYPAPYFRAKTGGVYLKTRPPGEEDEITTTIWSNDLYVVRRLTDPEFGEVVEMRHHLPRDGVKSFVVPLYVVTSKEEFRRELAKNGVAAINKEVDLIMAYTQTWVKSLQHTNSADDAHRQFGWIGDFAGFVCGEEVIFADRKEYNAPSSGTRGLTEHFLAKGTLEGWKDAMDFYNRPGFELHQFVVCAGFGSVLMKFMPINAAMIHLWSKDSGFGKTTVQHAALSAWGNPSKLILGERDTYNSKMNRADVMHSLPVCMDEITNIRPADASDLIYQVTGGQQRNRMSANGNTERYRGDPWNLLFISSANCSLIDKVALAKTMPKAEAQRVLEIEVSKLFKSKDDKAATDQFSRSLHENYGHAGPVFVEYVLQNLPQVETLITTIQRQIDRAAGLGPENRFWSAVAAVSISAAVICNHLGLLRYDVKTLRNYVVDHVLKANMKASVEMQSDPMSLVTEFVYQNWGRILQIKSTIDLRGKHHGNGLDNLVVPDQMPRSTDMVGRYETDMRRLFLIAKPFREWLADQQLNFASVAQELKEKHGAKRQRMRISKGTAMNLPPADVLEISMRLEEPDDGAASQRH